MTSYIVRTESSISPRSRPEAKGTVVHVYSGPFDYWEFAKEVAPKLIQYIEYPDEEDTVDDLGRNICFLRDEDLDATEEEFSGLLLSAVMGMLENMRIEERYDGRTGNYETFECTYIEAPIMIEEGWNITYSSYPVNVLAKIKIVPKECIDYIGTCRL